MIEALRHGLGGDVHKRDKALRERREANIELIEHPLADAKFGSGEAENFNFLFIYPVEPQSLK